MFTFRKMEEERSKAPKWPPFINKKIKPESARPRYNKQSQKQEITIKNTDENAP